MALVIQHNLSTTDLSVGDVVMRFGSDELYFLVDIAPIDDPDLDGWYRLTWAEQADGRLTWETTAPDWSANWVVVRERGF